MHRFVLDRNDAICNMVRSCDTLNRVATENGIPRKYYTHGKDHCIDRKKRQGVRNSSHVIGNQSHGGSTSQVRSIRFQSRLVLKRHRSGTPTILKTLWSPTLRVIKGAIRLTMQPSHPASSFVPYSKCAPPTLTFRFRPFHHLKKRVVRTRQFISRFSAVRGQTDGRTHKSRLPSL